jgi:hypothetical protein
MEESVMNKTSVAQQAKTSGFFPPAHGILQRKCVCGNHKVAGGECAECAQKKSGLQRKLAIGASNDPLERESDRVAEQMMAAPLNSAVSGAPLHIQRFTGQASGQIDAAPASVDRVLADSGRPLEPTLRQDMEQRFGYDFSRVRVHSGAAAEQSAQEVNANAYTVGHNVVFGAGQFAPGTHGGRRLIAHELTHVVQQQGTATHRLQRSPKDDNTPSKDPKTEPKPKTERDEWLENNEEKLWVLKFGCKRGEGAAEVDIGKDEPLEFSPLPGLSRLCGSSSGTERVVPCIPPRKPGTGNFTAQCCEGGVSSTERCCAPSMINNLGTCCPLGTFPSGDACKPLQVSKPAPGPKMSTPSPAQKPPVQQAVPLPPLPGSTEIFFHKDRPLSGQPGSDSTVLTDEGQSNLPSLKMTLGNDPSLIVQLVGSCSDEGNDKYNYELGQRRAEWLASSLGLGANRLTNPPENDLRSECLLIRPGIVTCGRAGADKDINPRDRRVLVRIFKAGP